MKPSIRLCGKGHGWEEWYATLPRSTSTPALRTLHDFAPPTAGFRVYGVVKLHMQQLGGQCTCFLARLPNHRLLQGLPNLAETCAARISNLLWTSRQSPHDNLRQLQTPQEGTRPCAVVSPWRSQLPLVPPGEETLVAKLATQQGSRQTACSGAVTCSVSPACQHSRHAACAPASRE